MKPQQSTDKASEHNRHRVFLRALLFLTRASTRVVSTLSNHLSSIFITLPHNLNQLPLFASASVTDRVHRHRQIMPPPGLGGHAKSYYRVAPRPPKEANTTTTTCPTAADLSANHRASVDTSVLHLRGLCRRFYRPLRRNPDTRKVMVDPFSRPEEYPKIFRLHLLL